MKRRAFVVVDNSDDEREFFKRPKKLRYEVDGIEEVPFLDTTLPVDVWFQLFGCIEDSGAWLPWECFMLVSYTCKNARRAFHSYVESVWCPCGHEFCSYDRLLGNLSPVDELPYATSWDFPSDVWYTIFDKMDNDLIWKDQLISYTSKAARTGFQDRFPAYGDETHRLLPRMERQDDVAILFDSPFQGEFGTGSFSGVFR